MQIHLVRIYLLFTVVEDRRIIVVNKNTFAIHFSFFFLLSIKLLFPLQIFLSNIFISSQIKRGFN